MAVQEDPVFRKYGRLQTLATPVEIEPFLAKELEVYEKLDGGNCQIRQHVSWKLLPGNKANVLRGNIIDRRPWFKKFVGWTYSNETLFNLPSNLLMFGEWSGNHNIQYNPENTDQFFVIDVLDLESNRFLPYEKGKELLVSKGIDKVRFFRPLAKGKLNFRILANLLEEKSDYYDGPREGLVIKDYSEEQQRFFRLYHPMFSELIALRNGSLDPLTPSRYRKNLYRLLEESDRSIFDINEISREVIKDLEYDGFETRKDKKVQKLLKKYLVRGDLSDIKEYIKK